MLLIFNVEKYFFKKDLEHLDNLYYKSKHF